MTNPAKLSIVRQGAPSHPPSQREVAAQASAERFRTQALHLAATARQRVAGLEQELGRATVRARELEQQVSGVTIERDSALERLKAAMAQLQKAGTMLKDAGGKLEEERQRSTALAGRVSSLDLELDQAHETINRLTREKNNLHRDQQTLKERLLDAERRAGVAGAQNAKHVKARAATTAKPELPARDQMILRVVDGLAGVRDLIKASLPTTLIIGALLVAAYLVLSHKVDVPAGAVALRERMDSLQDKLLLPGPQTAIPMVDELRFYADSDIEIKIQDMRPAAADGDRLAAFEFAVSYRVNPEMLYWLESTYPEHATGRGDMRIPMAAIVEAEARQAAENALLNKRPGDLRDIAKLSADIESLLARRLTDFRPVGASEPLFLAEPTVVVLEAVGRTIAPEPAAKKGNPDFDGIPPALDLPEVPAALKAAKAR